MRLIPHVVTVIRRKGYSLTTEKTYVGWIKRFIRFHDYKHPSELSEEDIILFLNHLAKDLHVSATTQNQALNSVVFLYRHVLKIDLGDFSSFHKAKRPEVLPVVLSQNEISQILSRLEGTYFLMTSLLYGCGFRLRECLRLRIKDIDFERKVIFVRQGKGKKDRTLPLPFTLEDPLKSQISSVKSTHLQDLKDGFGSVYLPNALERKYPNAAYDFKWQYLFPAHRISKDPRSGAERRHHLHHSVLIRHIRKAASTAGVEKRITSHSFRHSFATHLLEANKDIRTIQELLGHSKVKTTMIYTHVAKCGAAGTESPLDTLDGIHFKTQTNELNDSETNKDTASSRIDPKKLIDLVINSLKSINKSVSYIVSAKS